MNRLETEPDGSEPTKRICGNLLFQLVVLVVFVSIFSIYTQLSRRYPFYFAHDMDHMNTIEALLVQEGKIPHHLIQLSYGMYITFFGAQKIAYHLGSLSILNLADLQACLNPLAAVAESADFLRGLSPWVLISIVVILPVCVFLLTKISRWYLILVFLILATQESIIYQIPMTRTEVYSILFWSLAFLSLILALHARKFAMTCILFILAGIFTGLSFTTKVQALLYLVALFPFLPFLHEQKALSAGKGCLPAITGSMPRIFFGISAVNLLFFVIFSVISYDVTIPEGMNAMAKNYAITPFFIVTLVFLAGLPGLQILLAKRN